MDGKTIKEWRESKGLSRDELAKHCAVSYGAVANWELGRNAPHGAALERLKELMSGDVAVIPLTPRESKLLDSIVDVGGYRDRLDFLSQAVALAVAGDLKSGATSPYKTEMPENTLPLVAEPGNPYRPPSSSGDADPASDTALPPCMNEDKIA